MSGVILGLIIWGCASLAICTVWVVVAYLLHRQPSVLDEEFVTQLQELVRTELHQSGHETTTEVRLATEDDALAWGFPADWMAAERVELFWASRKEQA